MLNIVALSICSAAASGLAAHAMGRKVEAEDMELVEEGGEAARETLSAAAADGTLSPAAAERAAEAGLLSEEQARRCAGKGYSDRYALRFGCGVPYEAAWAAASACALGALALAGARDAALATCAGALSSAWLDSARRLAARPIALATWGAGAYAAGLSPLAAAGSLAACAALFAASGAFSRRLRKDSVGRGDDMLLACTLAGCGSLARATVFCAALCAALAAQMVWLRARGEAGRRQPLACALAPAYLLAWALAAA